MNSINLIKKDMLISGKQILVVLLIPIMLPLLFNQNANSFDGFFTIYMSISFFVYLYFQTIFISEDKYKGLAYIVSTPYTRKTIVKSKYLSFVLLCLLTVIVYKIMCIFSFVKITVSLSDISKSFFIITLFYCIIFPLYFKLGFTVIKYILILFSVLPFYLIPLSSKLLSDAGIKLSFLEEQNTFITFALFIIAFIVLIISLTVSSKIFSNRDL